MDVDDHGGAASGTDFQPLDYGRDHEAVEALEADDLGIRQQSWIDAAKLGLRPARQATVGQVPGPHVGAARVGHRHGEAAAVGAEPQPAHHRRGQVRGGQIAAAGEVAQHQFGEAVLVGDNGEGAAVVRKVEVLDVPLQAGREGRLATGGEVDADQRQDIGALIAADDQRAAVGREFGPSVRDLARRRVDLGQGSGGEVQTVELRLLRRRCTCRPG
jgi:hypothetical protein